MKLLNYNFFTYSLILCFASTSTVTPEQVGTVGITVGAPAAFREEEHKSMGRVAGRHVGGIPRWGKVKRGRTGLGGVGISSGFLH